MQISKSNRKETIVVAPPAKAYTLRAIMLSALAKGTSEIINPLLADDQLALMDSLAGLGIAIERKTDRLIIRGGGGKFNPVAAMLNLGESGVGLNLLLSATSLAGCPVTLTGKEGLLKRPVAEIIGGLRQLGCELQCLEKEGYPPVKNAGKGIPGGHTKMSGSKNSQYFSSIAVSAPYAEQPVIMECTDDLTEKPYYDITLEMMGRFGIKVQHEAYKITRFPNKCTYEPVSLVVEGDYSSASYYFLIAALCGSTVHVKGLNPVSLQGDKKTVDLLAVMGCEVRKDEEEIILKGGNLHAIEADMSDIPDMVGTIAVAAAFAKGTTVIRNVGHLRFKECNRLEAVASNLKRMGVKASYDDKNLYVEGNPAAHGARIDAYNDHRIAMSFACVGMHCGDIIIEDEKCVGKSFPDFWDRIKAFY